jgi:hypothetical protein
MSIINNFYPFFTDSLAPVYANGAKVDDLVVALQDSSKTKAGQRVASEERFWSTTSREQSSTVKEVFEITLATEQNINYLDFLLAHFPQTCYAQWWDENSGEWKNFTTVGNRTRNVSVSIFNSIPKIISPSLKPYVVHPQHYGAGHWQNFYIKTSPVKTSKVRLVLSRSSGQGPTEPFGKELPYSLGVKDFDCGYLIDTKDDIPRLNAKPEAPSETLGFDVSEDILGSSIEFAVRTQRASDLLLDKTWRCDPQPVFNSVVPLYLDVRNNENEAQLIDRFFIDPLYTGPRVNIYYSDEEPTANFKASDSPIGYPFVQQIDSGFPVTTTSDGLILSGKSGLDVLSKRIQLVHEQPFSLAFSIQNLFDHDWPGLPAALTTQPDGRVLKYIDIGILQIYIFVDPVLGTYSGIYFVSGDGQAIINVPFIKYETLNITVVGDGTNITVGVNGEFVELTTSNSGANHQLVLGSRASFETDMWRLNQLILKQSAMSINDIESFYASPSNYVQKSTFVQDDNGSTDNALLRIHPDFQSDGENSVSEFGMLGGLSNRLNTLTWKSVNRDFSLRRGIIEFNPVMAKYFKFEFTDLVPEVYETVSKPTKVVKTIPVRNPTLPGPLRIFTLETSAHKGGAGVSIINSVSQGKIYGDSFRTEYIRQNSGPNSPYTRNEVLYSSNFDIAEKLRNVFGYFNFVPWQGTSKINRWPTDTVHEYVEQEIPFQQRIAYFVGLRALKVYKVDYLASDNTERYQETFDTEEFFNKGGWDWHNGFISTNDVVVGDGAVAESYILNSDLNVTGLQFATTQSQAIQVMDDPDFAGGYTNWVAIGDATVDVSDKINSIAGQTLVVNRQSASTNTWDYLDTTYPTWDDLLNSDPTPFHPTWQELSLDPDLTDMGGIASIDLVDFEDGDRIYAAARIYSENALTEPVALEIFFQDPDAEPGNGDTLASAIVQPGRNQFSEWFVSYVAGTAQAPPKTWDEIIIEYSTPSWNTMQAVGTWNDIDGNFRGPLGVRIVQNVFAQDVFYVDNVSIYVDPIKWEFSNDGGENYYEVAGIRNKDTGAFVFPVPGNKLRWRVSSKKQGATVTGLVVRPFYDIYPLGVPYRESIQFSGPADSPIDQYMPISEDPWFKLWDKPIPENWWLEQQQWLHTGSHSLFSSEIYQQTYIDTY